MDVLINVLGYPLTYIEFFGVIAYFLSVYFAIKVNIWTWSTSIISQILFFILYINSHIYANAVLQIVLILVCIDGWLKWGKKDNKNISNLLLSNRLYLLLISALAIIFLGSIINLLPILPDPYPYLDMSIFVLSVIGVYLLAIKKIESWYVWIIVNIITIILCSLLGYYLIVIQCIGLIVMNIFALKEWNKLKEIII